MAHIAKSNIALGEALAYSRGQRVEDAWLEQHPEHRDSVVGENTKEAREIKAELTGRPVGDFETSSGTTTAGRSAKTSSQEG